MNEEIWKQRIELPKSRNANRCPYNRDRARIIHSSSFRRLQGKTQIFGLGESDFYRTRLTHSMEVAQISSGLVQIFRGNKGHDLVKNELLPPDYLIEAIGLAHDIGHPPFGHSGERALNHCMLEQRECFEGNAQTFRICTILGEHSKNHGFNLTRRAILGLIKYPISFETMSPKTNYNKLKTNKPPKCLYSFDETFDWVMMPFGEARNLFTQTDKKTGLYPSSKYKSLDCSIMELADDISYGVHDLEDAIALNFISKEDWMGVVSRIKELDKKTELKENIDTYTEKLFSNDSRERKDAIGDLIHYFMNKVTVNEEKIFDHWLLRYQFTLPKEIREELDLLNSLIKSEVINHPNVKMLEFAGEQMVKKIFQAISENPRELLPINFRTDYDRYGLRTVADYIAGMTDAHAARIYKQLYSPDEGNLFQKL